MDVQKLYETARDIALALGFIFVAFSSAGLIFARNVYDIAISGGFLGFSVFFLLEIWVVIKTNWETDEF